MIEVPQVDRSSYPIRDAGQYFFTGRTSTNDQILFGIIAEDGGLEVACVWFDSGGRFLRFHTERVTARPGQTAEDAAQIQLAEFQDGCGYRPEAIHVERFSVPGRFIRIDDIPEHYQKFLSDPSQYEPERQEELAGDIRKWVDDGDFVLWWGEDYYVDKEGEVVSS